MVSFDDYLSQDTNICNDAFHTDESYTAHDDHDDHVDVWVDEGDEAWGHSGHADS